MKIREEGRIIAMGNVGMLEHLDIHRRHKQ
jgi:hypothetical protein